jgi:hypothetical protein
MAGSVAPHEHPPATDGLPMRTSFFFTEYDMRAIVFP